jgi:hypothetical protein
LNGWENPVSEEACQAADPIRDEVGDKDVPSVDDKVGMHERVHGHRLGAHDLCDGRETEDPREEIPPASKVSTHAAIPSRSDGCPVIDCSECVSQFW